jgi:hypothetical protein
MRARGLGYRLSQRARKKIEELFGEGKDWHGLRRVPRRGLLRVRQETYLIVWFLNLKRLTTLLGPQMMLADRAIPAAHIAAVVQMRRHSSGSISSCR